MAIGHIGSWGTPELGVTEFVGGLLGYGRDKQGGSNISQPINDFYNPNSQWNRNLQESVKDAETSSQKFYNTVNNTNQNQTTGGNGGSGGSGGGGGTGQWIADNNVFTNESDYRNYIAQRDYWNSEAGKREQATRNNIENIYGDISNRINTFRNNLPIWKTEDLNTLGQSVSSMKNQLQTAKQAGLDTVESFRGDVDRREKLGIERIQDNLRNLLRTTSMQLGAMGAGSSSASEIMAPYALQKQATRSFGDIINQSNQQYAELDREEINIRKEFDLQIQQVDQWEAEQKQRILDRIRAFEQAIMDAQNSNDQARLLALTQLEAGLMNAAQQKLDQIEAYAMQERAGLQEWARNRMAQLNDMKLKLNPNFNPREIVAQEIRGIGGGIGQGAGDFFYNPMALRRRDEQV